MVSARDSLSKSTRRRSVFFGPAVIGFLAPLAAALAADETKPGADLLPETVVTATRTETPSRQIGSSLSVITGTELERRQTRFVSDALRTVPGVSVNRTSSFGSFTDVRIRGAESNQTLVLIDGVEVNDPALGSLFDFGNLLTTDVERIEVLRGPQSVLYGSDAIGGVVNVITKRGERGPTVSGSAEYGSFNSLQSNAAISGGGKMYNFALAGSHYRTDGISAADEDAGNEENDPYRNNTVIGTASFRPFDFLELNLAGRYQRTKLKTDAFIFSAVDDSSFNNGRERFGRAEAKVTLLDNRWTHSLSGSLFNNKLESGGGSFGPGSTEGDRENLRYQTDFKFSTPDIADATHEISFGAERDKEKVLTINSFSTVDRKIKSKSYYTLYQMGLWDRLFLTAGGRFDENDFFDDTTTYRATAAFLFPKTGTKLHSSGGKAVKNPTVFELFGFTSTFSGNPNLKPERSHGFDVGIEQKLFGDRVVADATFFYNRISDLIIGFGNTAENLSGRSTIKGVELSGRAQVVDGLDVIGSYTWMTTSDPTGTQLVRRPRHLASLAVNYGFLEKKRANVNLSLTFNGSQQDVAFGPTRRVTLAEYVLLNIAASYRVNDHLEIYARGENLLDQNYQEVFTFGAPGIAGYGGLRLRFEPLKLLKGET